MDDRTERIRIIVEVGVKGERLDRALAARTPQLSRSRLQALIRDGQVTISGRTIVEPRHPVNSGDAILIEVPPPTPAVPSAQDIALDILHEDNAIIVVNKPAGLVVHPGAGRPDGTLVNALLAHCGETLSGIGGVQRPGIVHRLDKQTSGVLVVAKSDAAHRDLSA
jgi:23S rRNA pseudouridine1911/1915/1917 synthase